MTMTLCHTAFGSCRMLLVDDEGQTRIAGREELEEWAKSLEPDDTDPVEVASETGFIYIWRCGRDVLVLLRPDKVNPITMVGAMDTIARLDQDWTIICSMSPGGQMEWFRGYVPAIHRIESLLEEAGRLPPSPADEPITTEAEVRREAASALLDC